MITTDELTNLVEKLVGEHDKVPGASVAIRTGDDVATGVAGVLNLNTGVEVTPDSIFQIGSNTKVFNATLVMQLVDEGKVDLDQPVVTYLPEFQLADAEATGQITVRHLLTHTSGIDGGDYIEDFGRGDDAIAKYVASLRDVGMVHPIGKFWSYCNAATVVAGRLVEVLTGLPWHEALKTRILEPLGMDHSVALPEEAILFRAAAGHLPDPANGDAIRVFPTWTLPFGTGPAGATMNCSASDLTIFGRTHLNGGVGPNGIRILSEASTASMRESQFDIGAGGGAVGQHQAIGWMLSEQGGCKIVSHGGGTFGQSSQFMLLPEHDVVITVLTNGPDGGQVIAGVVKEVLSRVGVALPEAPSQPDEAATAPALPAAPELDLSKYAGVYERRNLRTTLEVDGDHLVTRTELSGFVARMPAPKPMTLRPVTDTTFLVLTDEGKPGGQAIFAEFDAGGRPELYILGRVAKRVV